MTVSIIGVTGIGDIAPGDDLPEAILAALAGDGIELVDGDVVVVTHKIVSKAEGAIEEVGPDPDAHRAVVEREAAAILRRRGSLVIAETRHGFVCANAGVDRSNVAPGWVVLLPRDPDRSAHGIRRRLEEATGRRLAVIVTDTFGRPWRRGLVDVAIGASGLDPIADHRGATDAYGNRLEVTEVAIADEIAAAADLVMGKTRQVPVAIVRGLALPPGEGRVVDRLVRPPSEDLFR